MSVDFPKSPFGLKNLKLPPVDNYGTRSPVIDKYQDEDFHKTVHSDHLIVCQMRWKLLLSGFQWISDFSDKAEIKSLCNNREMGIRNWR